MRERFAFKEEFEPVVNVGEILHPLPMQGKDMDKLYVKVLYIEALPYHERDFGPIGAGLTTGVTELIDVYMDDNELGQFRFVVVDDDVEIFWFAQPQASRRWVTENTQWGSLAEWADPRNNPMMEKYHLHEFFQWEDDRCWVDLTTVGGVAASRIGFYGFRYVVEVLDKVPTVYTSIPVHGFRSQA